MDVSPVTFILIVGNLNSFFNPAGWIFVFGGFELFRRAVAECADVPLVQREYVSTRRCRRHWRLGRRRR